MLTACVFVTRDTVRYLRRFVFGKFVRKPNCSWSEAFANRGLTVLTFDYSDLLRVGRSRNRIPVGGEIFHTGPGVRPACYTMGTEPFWGGGWSGRGVALTTHPRLVDGIKSKAIPLPPSWPSYPVIGWPLPLFTYILRSNIFAGIWFIYLQPVTSWWLRKPL